MDTGAGSRCPTHGLALRADGNCIRCAGGATPAETSPSDPADSELTASQALGKTVATLGAGSIALSVILGMFLGMGGLLLELMGIGGALVGGVGIVMWRRKA